MNKRIAKKISKRTSHFLLRIGTPYTKAQIAKAWAIYYPHKRPPRITDYHSICIAPNSETDTSPGVPWTNPFVGITNALTSLSEATVAATQATINLSMVARLALGIDDDQEGGG